MAGKDNLVPLTTEKAREIGKIGGRKSVEVRRARKTLKEELLLLLSEDKVQESITLALLKEALKGNNSGSVTKAFEVIRDTIGEKPVEEIKHSGSIEEYISKVEGKNEY